MSWHPGLSPWKAQFNPLSSEQDLWFWDLWQLRSSILNDSSCTNWSWKDDRYENPTLRSMAPESQSVDKKCSHVCMGSVLLVSSWSFNYKKHLWEVNLEALQRNQSDKSWSTEMHTTFCLTVLIKMQLNMLFPNFFKAEQTDSVDTSTKRCFIYWTGDMLATGTPIGW